MFIVQCVLNFLFKYYCKLFLEIPKYMEFLKKSLFVYATICHYEDYQL